MSTPIRCFVAVPIPADVAESLGRVRRAIEAESGGSAWKWVRPENLHLTLAFLGDVEDTSIPDLSEALAIAASPFGPFHLRVDGLGGFPTASRPRVLWAGIGGAGLDDLLKFQAEIARAANDRGHPPDQRGGYHPHVTLARVRGRAGPVVGLPAIEPREFEVRATVLYASTLERSGPRHDPLRQLPHSATNPADPPTLQGVALDSGDGNSSPGGRGRYAAPGTSRPHDPPGSGGGVPTPATREISANLQNRARHPTLQSEPRSP